MNECEGHPAGEFDPMGETVYCDGSCRDSIGGSAAEEAAQAAHVAEENAGELEAAILELERELLAEGIQYAEAATSSRPTGPSMGAMIAAGWRFGLGNVATDSELGAAALRLQDRGLLTVDWRAGAFRVTAEQLPDARAALAAVTA